MIMLLAIQKVPFSSRYEDIFKIRQIFHKNCRIIIVR
ncbi:hypothetical protein pb186bvf_017098 [Paramecium bursaria]